MRSSSTATSSARAGSPWYGWAVRLLVAVVAVLATGDARAAAAAGEWRVGVATVKITPDEPIWMAGYASRDKPAAGTLQDLWAKALVLQAADGKRVALVSLDLVGIDRETSDRIRAAVAAKHGIPREAVALCSSHTHSGPVVGMNLRAAHAFDDAMAAKVSAYTDRLVDRVADAVGRAAADLKPATVRYGVGHCTFAVNRRQNKEPDVDKLVAAAGPGADPAAWRSKLAGPVDHDLPVLAVADADGKAVATVFGYACHATTLSGYEWTGDWPGFAAEAITAATGAPAFFVAGCGADQNPVPRRKVEQARGYGKEAADAVAAVLAGGKMQAVPANVKTAYAEIDLPFAALPSREELEQQKASPDPKQRYAARRAAMLLERIRRDGGLPKSYPYPVQTWSFGGVVGADGAAGGGGAGPRLVFLGGEVVVDYALRLKKELAGNTWPVAYANDVMAYIPSKRVLDEGGYEGGGAMVYYGQPTVWGAEVEERIVAEVRRQAGNP
ncbi:MAG TPA: neutral/alkaline non-lysosomal ceramidase N-terminal domain-containing protein [Humisphaera sp.]